MLVSDSQFLHSFINYCNYYYFYSGLRGPVQKKRQRFQWMFKENPPILDPKIQ